MDYLCTNCHRTFPDFAAAHNHELKNGYKHITAEAEAFGETTTRIEELVICSLRTCGKAVASVEAVYSPDSEDPYCSLEHQAENRLARAIGFYEKSL